MEEDTIRELGGIIKSIYEKYEMLSRWTPEFTAKEFIVVLSMRGQKSYTVGEVARATHFPMSTTSFLLDNLVKKKIVSRIRRETDRRVVSIALTDKGKRAVGEYDRIFEEIGKDMLQRLTKSQSLKFLNLLRTVMVAEGKS